MCFEFLSFRVIIWSSLVYRFTHTHTHIYIYMFIRFPLANALNLLVSTTEQSGNMKKVLTQTFFEIVSTVRNLFVKLRNIRDSNTTDIGKLEMEVTKLKAELEEWSSKHVKEHGTPSLYHCQEAADIMAKEHGTPSLIECQEVADTMPRNSTRHLFSNIQKQLTQWPRNTARHLFITVKNQLGRQQVLCHNQSRGGKLYSDAVGGEKNLKSFILTVQLREKKSP